MANNRMYIVCRHCEDFISLAKTMGDGWYSRSSLGNQLNDFFDTHDHDHALEDGTGSKQYALVQEVDDLQVELYDFANRKIKLKSLLTPTTKEE